MTIYLSKTIFAGSQSILISRPTVAFYVAVVPSRCLGFIWLRCHFMPASPPLPAKEHYFLSHSLQFNFLIISKHLFHLWMCLPRTLLMICCDSLMFVSPSFQFFICCVICFGSNSQSVRREWMLHGGVR